jgi:hypothetical protein
MKKTAGYTLMVCAFAAGAWIAATAIGSGDANSTEATPAATDEPAALDARFVEPTSVDYGANLEPR